MFKMKIFAFVFFSLFIWMIAISGSPTVIAVLDTPVDYSHPEIQAVLEEDLLKNAQFVDERGEEKSWYDLNLEAKAEFEKRLNQELYAEQIEYLNAMHGSTESRSQTGKNLKFLIARGTLKYIFSPKYRSSLNIVAKYLHGTHVAGIMMKSLSNVRLISFPLLKISEKMTLSDILNYDPVPQREEMRQQFEQISKILQSNHVRVVNLSIGTSHALYFKEIRKRATLVHKTVFRKKLRNMSNESAKIFKEEMMRFIRANPNSVFVLGAGNDRRDLSKTPDHTATIEAENLIKVAAVSRSGSIARFSNHSPLLVDIAARGTGISSAMAGGGEIHMSGTSQAVPKVTNALAQIFESAPQISVQEAIDMLYEKHTKEKPSLADFVANGRVLAIDRLSLFPHRSSSENFRAEMGDAPLEDLKSLFDKYMDIDGLLPRESSISKNACHAIFR
ncbi:MAG: S8 family serine peptidase [Bdellovibrionota bacterium]